MLGLGRILISDLLVANLLTYSLPGMILLYLVVPFFTPEVFLDEIISTPHTTGTECWRIKKAKLTGHARTLKRTDNEQ